MALVDVLRGLTKGVAGAAGNEDAVRDLTLQQQQARQNQQQNQDLQLKTQLAPLIQASAGYQKQLVDLTDPNTGLPYAGKEDQYHAVKNSLADVIGKTRMILHPPPPEDPHGIGYLVHRATDVLHITNDAAQKAREAQSQRVNDYYQNLNDSASNQANILAAANGGNPLTPEQQITAAAVHANITPKAVAPKPPSETPLMKLYKLQNGTFKYLDSKKPDELPAGAQPATVSATNPKTPNRDDRYIAIEQKKIQGQPLSPDEQAYTDAYDLYVKKTKTDPGIARAAAYGANRYIPVIDPENPQQTTVMPAAQAAAAHIGTPASIWFQTDKALEKAFTSGNEAKAITAFNTASDHLRMLSEAAKALDNGDVTLFNKWKNEYAKATGNPAPTNFDTIKAAASGEIAKTFGELNIPGVEAVNRPMQEAGSPAQLAGAIGNNYALMQSKIKGLKGQYEAGRAGHPNFGDSGPDVPVGPKTKQLQGMQSGSSQPAYIYARDPQGNLHRAKPGTKLPQGWTLTNGPR